MCERERQEIERERGGGSVCEREKQGEKGEREKRKMSKLLYKAQTKLERMLHIFTKLHYT